MKNTISTDLRVLCRVIKRYIQEGRNLNDILVDYPKLTVEEIKIIRSEISDV